MTNLPLAEVLIRYSLKQEMKDLLLTAGTSANNFRTSVYVRIEDHFGEFVKRVIATVTVSVRPFIYSRKSIVPMDLLIIL